MLRFKAIFEKLLKFCLILHKSIDSRGEDPECKGRVLDENLISVVDEQRKLSVS